MDFWHLKKLLLRLLCSFLRGRRAEHAGCAYREAWITFRKQFQWTQHETPRARQRLQAIQSLARRTAAASNFLPFSSHFLCLNRYEKSFFFLSPPIAPRPPFRFETSSTTMIFCLHLLAHHQEIQNEARESIKSILIKYNGEFCYEAVQEMTFVEQIIEGDISRPGLA